VSEEHAHAWRPVRATRASADVVEQIRDAFFHGLKPGDWLGTEKELADRFGVSRPTMRDAIRALETRGIVEVKVGARGGLRIAGGEPERYVEALAVQLRLMSISWTEILEAQQAIEPVTAGLAARHATSEQVEALRELIQRSRKAMGDHAAFSQLGLGFHLAVAEVAGNRVLLSTLRALRTVQNEPYRMSTSMERARRVVRLHTGILDAIEAGDAELASRRMSEHLAIVARNSNVPTRPIDPCLPLEIGRPSSR
jgi:GntR family transcriptional repressor for pyruvate dehydrogenase complex